MSKLYPSGALWLPERGIALIADLHLGFALAHRRRGELWPLTDGGAKARLAELCNELQPKTLVLVGDVIYAPRPCPEEEELIGGTLNAISKRTQVICVAGNHDRRQTIKPNGERKA
jgi:metallophosphoesterase superfamily enzyme